MRPGFMVTIQKASFNLCNGSIQNHQGSKKYDEFCSDVKVMLTCFLDSCGIVHHKYAPEGQTINKEYYLKVLFCLCDAVQRKWQDVWTGKNWQLHYDNASTHSTHVIKGFLAETASLLLIWHHATSGYSPS